MIAQFKASTTRRANDLYGEKGARFWHRNYHDHIIHNHDAYLRIQEYIEQNPNQWEEDLCYKL